MIESQLLQRQLRLWGHHASWQSLTVPVLREIAQCQGMDFATALIYDRIARSSEHGPFMDRVVAQEDTALIDKSVLLGIVPGAFHTHHQGTGADGQRLLNIAAALGYDAQRIALKSFGSLHENAAIIAQWLGQQFHRKVVLLSLSKGGCEVKVAAEPRPDALRKYSTTSKAGSTSPASLTARR